MTDKKEKEKIPFNPNCDICGKLVTNVIHDKCNEPGAGRTIITIEGKQFERHYICDDKL